MSTQRRSRMPVRALAATAIVLGLLAMAVGVAGASLAPPASAAVAGGSPAAP